MIRDLMIYAARQYYPVWGERMRPAQCKQRLVREDGPMTLERIEHYIQEFNCGLSILVGHGVLVLDRDGPNLGPFAKVEGECVSTTSRGEHHWFKTDIVNGTNKIKAGGFDVDLIVNNNSVVVVPPSPMSTGKLREWRKPLKAPHELPLFPRELYEQVLTRKMDSGAAAPLKMTTRRTFKNVEAWCMKVESVQGCNGSAQLVRVVTALRDAGKTAAEAFAFLWNVWNPVCAHPTWSEAELRRCVNRFIRS